MNITRMKLDLFCHGVRLDPELRAAFREYRPSKRASLSEGASFNLKVDGKTFGLNVAVREPFIEKSPFRFSSSQGVILKNDKPTIEAGMIGDPDWYKNRLPDGTPYGNIVQLHGTNVLAVSLNNFCMFKKAGVGCKFCALGASSKEDIVWKPGQVARIVEDLTSNGMDLSELNINSGTLNGKDQDAKFYLEVIEEVRKISDIPISAQILPPEDFEYIRALQEAGLNTISFNLEIYDESIRGKVCPGKSSTSRKTYLLAMEKAVSIFGQNQVSSWVIAGLEPPKSTIQGIKEIASSGAIPFVAVFRPLLGTELEEMSPPALESLLRIFDALGEALEKEKLDPTLSSCGCVRCNCCSAFKEVYEHGL